MKEISFNSDVFDSFRDYIEELSKSSKNSYQNPLFFIILKLIILRILTQTVLWNNDPWKEIMEFVHRKDLSKMDLFLFEKKIDDFLMDYYGIPKNVIEGISTSLNDKIIQRQHENAENEERLFKIGLVDLIDKISNYTKIEGNKILESNTLGSLYEIFILQHKKQTGVYYTPEIITEYICSSTFNAKIHNEEEIISKSKPNQIESLLNLVVSYRILDPSCGCGYFLSQMYRIAYPSYKKMIENLQLDNDSVDIIWLKNINGLTTLKNKDKFANTIASFLAISQLHGLDLDSSAIGIAKITVWLLSLLNFSNKDDRLTYDEYTHLTFQILERNIIKSDFLVDFHKNASDLKSADKFDIIIGNPPYVSSKEIDGSYKEKIKKISTFVTAVKQFDLYSIFMEKSFYLLKDNGYFGFIVPEAFLARSQFTPIRSLIINNTKILSIDQIQNAFMKENIILKGEGEHLKEKTKSSSLKIGVSNIILLYTKANYHNNGFQYDIYNSLADFKEKKMNRIFIAQDQLVKEPDYRILFTSDKIKTIIDAIRSDSTPLGEMIMIHRGEEIGRDAKFVSPVRTPNLSPILFGENISRYSLKNTIHYIPKEKIDKTGINSLYSQPKIMIRQLGTNINAMIDENGGYVTSQTVYNISSKKITINNHYLLGLFNSKMIQFYYSAAFVEKKLFPRILIENIKKLPAKIPSEEFQIQITEKVKKLLEINITNDIQAKLEKEIDNLIYQIYRLDQNSINIIEHYLSNTENK
jgi:adenine-specific DNA-methyltransferase